VDKEAYLAQVVRYLRLDPVEAGLVREPKLYGWSADGSYLRSKEAPSWMRTDEVMAQFVGKKEFH